MKIKLHKAYDSETNKLSLFISSNAGSCVYRGRVALMMQQGGDSSR